MEGRQLSIRLATSADHDAIWTIFRDVIAAGGTYVFDPKTSRNEALAYWFCAETHTYVAVQDRHVIGSYILKPNQPGLGAHVSNASFIVARNARGLGVGRAMGEHCLSEARRLGFRGPARILATQVHRHVHDDGPAGNQNDRQCEADAQLLGQILVALERTNQRDARDQGKPDQAFDPP